MENKELNAFINPTKVVETDLALFEKELLNLFIKHNLYISGCRCCNSPFLVKPLNNEEIVDEVKHIINTI